MNLATTISSPSRQLAAAAATTTVAYKNSVHPEETPVHADGRPPGWVPRPRQLPVPPSLSGRAAAVSRSVGHRPLVGGALLTDSAGTTGKSKTTKPKKNRQKKNDAEKTCFPLLLPICMHFRREACLSLDEHSPECRVCVGAYENRSAFTC
ncbi:hypothetical protein MAPG_11032 [Magnaporthiopsis poae ATCC 64411]|uniref:Uncharacterized protein n=1 Tax=Magnaporthiopsis poae (strain ATCC 64411 / 73-15) TaxID=644358 RepID=A0A0C4EE67_MAGP6|nr:hypothetical protein MAPG_11032 [Magnaporthiopsis poae ATCC 64411]